MKAITEYGTKTNSPYEGLDEDLGQGMTEAELYFWATEKRKEGLLHRSRGHENFCQSCKACLCGSFRWKCICASGRKYVTPYRIGFTSEADNYIAKNGLVYCLNHQVLESKGTKC